MARKQKARARNRPRPGLSATPTAADLDAGGSLPGGPSSAAGVAGPGPRSQSSAVGGDQATLRRVEMSLAPAPRGARGRGSALATLSADPGIPYDRVPYFLPDLRQIAMVGGIMIVILVLAATFLIPLLLK